MPIHPEVEELREKYLEPFPELTSEEIARRQNTSLSYADVIKMICISLSSQNTNIDFRHYKDVPLGNTMFISVPDKYLQDALRNSKHAQQNFCTVNFGDAQLSMTVGPEVHIPEITTYVYPGVILRDREIVFNCTGAGSVTGNIKLGPQKIKFTTIFDGIEGMQCDMREVASDGQIAQYFIATRGRNQDIAGNWLINLFSANNAVIAGNDGPTDRPEKFTIGIIQNVYNKDTKRMEAQYDGAPLYYDDAGPKFGQVQLSQKDSEDYNLIESAVSRLESVVGDSQTLFTAEFTKEEYIQTSYALHDFLKERGYDDLATRLAKSFNERKITVVDVVKDQVLLTTLHIEEPVKKPEPAPQHSLTSPLLPQDQTLLKG